MTTAYTVSLDTPENMQNESHQKQTYPLLKVKLGGPSDENCIRAVRRGSPNARIIVDTRNVYKNSYKKFVNIKNG